MPQEPPAQWEMGEILPQDLCHLQGTVPSMLLCGNVPSGDSPSEGSRFPGGIPPLRSLPGKGRREQRRAGEHGKGQEGTEKGTVLWQSWDLCQMSLLFPFEKGEKVEFYSFLPCRSKRLGGSSESCSALPLPPLLAPALGSPRSPFRHGTRLQGQPGLGRGHSLCLGTSPDGLWGLQPQEEGTPPTNGVVGAELVPCRGTAGPGELVLTCLHTLPHEVPVGKDPWIPPALPPAGKLGGTGACQSQQGGLELTGAVPRGTEPL